MRQSTVFASVLAAALLAAPLARACEPIVAECLPRVVVFPAYTAEGLRVGTVEARVRPVERLQRSRFTGRPVTVVFNNPGSRPGLVDPYLERIPLPRVRPFDTEAVYPRGY